MFTHSNSNNHPLLNVTIPSLYRNSAGTVHTCSPAEKVSHLQPPALGRWVPGRLPGPTVPPLHHRHLLLTLLTEHLLGVLERMEGKVVGLALTAWFSTGRAHDRQVETQAWELLRCFVEHLHAGSLQNTADFRTGIFKHTSTMFKTRSTAHFLCVGVCGIIGND